MPEDQYEKRRPQDMVGLDETLTPAFWELRHDGEELVRRCIKLNLRLNTFRLPAFPFFIAKRRLDRIFEPFNELQAEMNRWLPRAGNYFILNPPGFLEGQDRVLTILWVQRELDRHIMTMASWKYILHYGYQFLLGRIEQKQNFQIAIASFLLAFAGLIYAVFAT